MTAASSGPRAPSVRRWQLGRYARISMWIMPVVIVLGAIYTLTHRYIVDGVILPAAAARFVLHQCSRSTPGPGIAYWTPSADDIANLERGLSDFVKSNPPRMSSRFHFEGSKRQYLGVVRNDHRAIYVNLFPTRSWLDQSWRIGALTTVCDGGASYFGVEYDVDHAAFTHIAFNGP